MVQIVDGILQFLKGGFLLYSVGPNGIDEQGMNRSDPPNYAGDDLRIRTPLGAGSISP